MHDYLNWLGATVPVFLLILARTAGMLTQAPVLGDRQAVPQTARAGLAFSLSLIHWVALSSLPAVPTTLLPYLLMVFREILVGLFFGYLSNLTFLGISSAGEFVGTAISLNIASTLKIPGQPQSTVLGPVFLNLARVAFLIIGGHLWLLNAYYQTYDLVPLGAFTMSGPVMEAVVNLTGSVFLIAVELAMPATIIMFLVDWGLGLLNRSIPSMSNILELVMAIKPNIGFLVLILMIPNVVGAVAHQADTMIRQVHAAVAVIGK